MVHCVLAFFFNTTLVALTIIIASGCSEPHRSGATLPLNMLLRFRKRDSRQHNTVRSGP